MALLSPPLFMQVKSNSIEHKPNRNWYTHTPHTHTHVLLSVLHHMKLFSHCCVNYTDIGAFVQLYIKETPQAFSQDLGILNLLRSTTVLTARLVGT